jgi:Asp/Glu/hydantoin racemase
MRKQEAEIGILCWEAGHVPRGLVQLESLVGNSTNPDSYAFPVRFCRVKGANIETILENPSPVVLRAMIEEARAMVADGVRAITTSCGFNAIFQQELADAVDVPVFTSSLLQVPFVQKIIGIRGEVAVITAKGAALKPGHLAAAGITRTENVHVHGLEGCTQWGKIFSSPDEDMDLEAVRQEILRVALKALELHPGTRAFVLECTDLPPFAEEIRDATGLPVFDFITLVNTVHASL